jgi:glycosyltransferase involved in cell wall biosynthesis
MRRVLMVAFHFPPLAGSSGIQRTLRFVQHLPAFGWEAVVLTAHQRAYEAVSDDLMRDIPAGVSVTRAFALDSARHLSIAGRYPGFLACPDRWVSWRVGGVAAGLKLIRDQRPDVIWSTYPIATAHLIGAALQRRSGLPWVADFRDPMAQDGYPEDPRVWRSFKRIEEEAVGNARFSVFTTRGAARIYGERYPASSSRIAVIENGFDEDAFAGLAGAMEARRPLNPGSTTLLHSGIVYPEERDPTHLFAAMGQLAATGRLPRSRLKVRFRATGHDPLLRALTAQHKLEDVVEVLPAIPYLAALEEMVRADGLLVLQAANCNEQIPAKLYEYLRAGRPILALTDPGGDTAMLLRDAGLDAVARLDSASDISERLLQFLDGISMRRARLPDSSYVARASRREQARNLAALLEQACVVNGNANARRS